MFGDITLFEGSKSYTSAVGTIEFLFPGDKEYLVLGLAVGGATGATGNSQIVYDFVYEGVRSILGTYGSGTPMGGVPARHIAAIGNNQFPKWPGSDASLKRIVDLAARGQGNNPAVLVRRAWRSLQRFARSATPDISGILVRGGKMRLIVKDITSGSSDDTAHWTLLALDLGSSRVRETVRGLNRPWWLSYPVTSLAAAAVPSLSISDTVDLPAGFAGPEARFLHIETRASLYNASSGAFLATSDADGYHLVHIGPAALNAPELFIGQSVPLSAFADGGALAIFEREYRQNDRVSWRGNKEAGSNATVLYLSDMLYSDVLV